MAARFREVGAVSGQLRSRFIDLADRGSFLVHTGGAAHGPAVILLHGLGATADLNWSVALEVLSRDFYLVAPDIRGHGETRASARFTLEHAADDVTALADALSIDSFIVVGYSMGGAVAQLVHLRHPGRLRGLVLCATGCTFRDSWAERLMWFATLPAVRVASRAVPDGLTRATTRFIARMLEGAAGVALGPDPTFDLGQVLQAVAALGEFDSRDWIGRVDLPSAVLVHLRDQVVAPSRQFALAQTMPDASVHPFDGDHFGVVKKPQMFVATLRAALYSVQRRTNLPTAFAI